MRHWTVTQIGPSTLTCDQRDPHTVWPSSWPVPRSWMESWTRTWFWPKACSWSQSWPKTSSHWNYPKSCSWPWSRFRAWNWPWPKSWYWSEPGLQTAGSVLHHPGSGVMLWWSSSRDGGPGVQEVSGDPDHLTLVCGVSSRIRFLLNGASKRSEVLMTSASRKQGRMLLPPLYTQQQ